MRRILLVLTVALVMAAMLVVMTAPAYAVPPDDLPTIQLPYIACDPGHADNSPVIHGYHCTVH